MKSDGSNYVLRWCWWCLLVPPSRACRRATPAPVCLAAASGDGIDHSLRVFLKVRPIWVKTLKARLAVDLGQNDKSGPARGKMVKVAPPQARENFGHSTLRRMPLAPPSRQIVPRQLQPSQRVKCCGRMRPYVSQTCSATCLDTHRRALSRGERQHFFSHSVRELLCRCGTIAS